MDALDGYITTLGGYEPLTFEQEQEYARRIQDGDENAYKEFVKRNLRLVVKIAAVQRKDTGVSLIELISAGNVGLMKAARNFKPGMGSRFAAYAKWEINISMHHEIYHMAKPVSFPKSMNEMKREKGECPFATMTFLSKDKRDDAECLSLYSMPDSSAPPDMAYAQDEKRIQVESWMSRLSDDEREVLALRFGLDGHEPTLFRRMEGWKISAAHAACKRAIAKLREMAAES